MADDYCFEDFEDEGDEEDFPEMVPGSIVTKSVSRFGLPSGFKSNLATAAAPPGEYAEDLAAKPSAPPVFVHDSGVLSADDVKLAVTRDDVTTLQRAISTGFPVDQPINADWSALMYAAHSGSIHCSKALLDAGANVHYHRQLYTVLMAACSSKCLEEERIREVVEILIQGGANVNAYDRHHMTALMYAAREGRASVVKVLVKAGAELNKQDNRGYSALMWAVLKQHPTVVYSLLDLGAKTDLRDRMGSTAHEHAVIEGYGQIEKLISQHATGQLKSNASSTADMHSGTKSIVNGTGLTNGTTMQNEPTTCHFGDLEMFLSGLGLGEMIPAFHAHHVTFEQLLRMRDDEIGSVVPQAGARRKIMDGLRRIHLKEWQESSLTPRGESLTSLVTSSNVSTSKKLEHRKKPCGGVATFRESVSCADAIFVVQNMRKHASYMACTVAWLRERLDADSMSGAGEGAGATELLVHCAHAQTYSKLLGDELRMLSDHVTQQSACAPPPDLISSHVTKNSGHKKGHRWSWMSGTVGLGILLLAFWKRQSLFSLLNNVKSSDL